MSSSKYAIVVNGIIDNISYDPDRERIIDFEEVDGEQVEIGWHWGDVLPPWEIVPDDVFAGFIRDGNGWKAPPVVPPVLPPYTIGADLPWSRMVSDEEADTVQGAIDASPVKTRNMINKATSFTQGADAFNKFKAIIAAALDADRADAIMGPPMPSELAATIGDEAA